MIKVELVSWLVVVVVADLPALGALAKLMPDLRQIRRHLPFWYNYLTFLVILQIKQQGLNSFAHEKSDSAFFAESPCILVML